MTDHRPVPVEHQAGLGEDGQRHGQARRRRAASPRAGRVGIEGEIALEDGMSPGDLDAKRTGVGDRAAARPVGHQDQGAPTGPEPLPGRHAIAKGTGLAEPVDRLPERQRPGRPGS